MNPIQRTLFVIMFFVVIIVGSFLMFVITWDPEAEEPIGARPVSERMA